MLPARTLAKRTALAAQVFALTAHAKAHVWDVAFGPGTVSSSIGQSGRGERIRASGSSADPLLHPSYRRRLSRIADPDTHLPDGATT